MLEMLDFQHSYFVFNGNVIKILIFSKHFSPCFTNNYHYNNSGGFWTLAKSFASVCTSRGLSNTVNLSMNGRYNLLLSPPKAWWQSFSHLWDSQLFSTSVAHLSYGMPKTPWTQGGPGVTPGTCGDIGEMAQVILVWVRALGIGDASHPRRPGVMRVRPWAYAYLMVWGF